MPSLPSRKHPRMFRKLVAPATCFIDQVGTTGYREGNPFTGGHFCNQVDCSSDRIGIHIGCQRFADLYGLDHVGRNEVQLDASCSASAEGILSPLTMTELKRGCVPLIRAKRASP